MDAKDGLSWTLRFDQKVDVICWMTMCSDSTFTKNYASHYVQELVVTSKKGHREHLSSTIVET
eukprot:scaffold19245_cov199-Amphora_coffeaeformis.AAC.38